jgi:hypothetical protein
MVHHLQENRMEITQVKGSGPYRRREKKLFRSGAESGVEISSS